MLSIQPDDFLLAARQGRLVTKNPKRAGPQREMPAAAARHRASQSAAARRRTLTRWLVHLGLIVSVVVSLIFEPVVQVIHLAARLLKITGLARPAGRLALTDALLAALTAAMLVSGFWDWFAGHPSRIRWHALTGVALTIVLAVHTIRRRSRLRRSKVR